MNVRRDDRVLVIELNRPDVLNTLNADLVDALNDAIAELDATAALRAGVLAGAGRGFCAGMDLTHFMEQGVPPKLERLLWAGAAKPIVAAVEGFALGGGLELALMCDLIVAARGAKLGIPEVRVGLFAAGGGLCRLGQRLPTPIALELALLGEPIAAEQALVHGLVNRVVERGRALPEALAMAHQIAANGPAAVQASKRLLRAAAGMGEEAFAAMQAPLMDTVFTSDESREGAAAFQERRPPRWPDR